MMFLLPSLDPTILVALIAAAGVLLSGLLSAFVSIWMSHRSTKIDKSKTAIEYLRSKIEILERQKAALSNKGGKHSYSVKNPDRIAKATAEALDNGFTLSRDVFNETRHYLAPERCAALSESLNLIEKSLAYERAKAWGIAKEPSHWKGDTSCLIKGADNINAMIDFIRTVEETIENEISVSVQKIEHLIRFP